MLLRIFATALTLLFGSAVLYKVIKMFHFEVYFKTVLLINVICAVLSEVLNAFNLNWIGAIAGFVVMGLLLKMWSTIESWKDILIIALITNLLLEFLFVPIVGALFVLMGFAGS